MIKRDKPQTIELNIDEYNRLINENNNLQKENADRLTDLKKEKLLNKNLQEQVKTLLLTIHGKKSEKSSAGYDPRQLTLFDWAPEIFNEFENNTDVKEKEPEIKTIPEHTRKAKKKGQKEDNLEGLEEIVTTYELENKICSDCGNELIDFSEKVVKEVVFEPAKLVVHTLKGEVCYCKECKKNGKFKTIAAKMPKSLIEKSVASPSLLANIITNKFANAMPLHRMEADFKRNGIDITKQNIPLGHACLTG